MSAKVAHLWRYPIKGVGAETLDHVTLTKDRPLPLDRAFAVLEDGGAQSDGWRSCRNFIRGAKSASLMAITARVDDGQITLSHPMQEDLTLPLSLAGQDALLAWLKPIYPETRKPPTELIASPPEGMADVPFASISILNLASLKALSQKAGRDLDPRRFRGNIWLEGLAPWEEFDLVGKTLSLGRAQLHIVEPITRCRATEANPKTGERDTPTLQILEAGWGHTDFGVYATVSAGGTVALGDAAKFA